MDGTKQYRMKKKISKFRSGRKSALINEKWYGYLFISPMVLGYLLFLLVPILTAFVMSFTDWSLLRETSFIGLNNYVNAFTQDKVFWETVGNTFYFTILLVPLNIVITLGLALLLKEKIFGIGFFRTTIFVPYATSMVVWAIIWLFIFQTDNGLVNNILAFFGIQGPAWLYNDNLAMPIVVLVTLIKGLGLNTIIFLVALQDVPKLYYEAAKIDGASWWRTFTNVTLPLITPSIFLVLFITLIGSMKVFSQIYVLTDGGPGTSTYVLVYYIYQTAFRMFEFGYASTISFILFFIVLILTILQWMSRRRWVYYEE